MKALGASGIFIIACCAGMTIELYMSLEGQAALKVEEVVESSDGMMDVTKMWEALDRALLLIDYRESRYRQFSTRCMRHGERMTEYLHKIICLFRKARLCVFVQFQDEVVKNHLINGLSTETLIELLKGKVTWTYQLKRLQISMIFCISNGRL